MLLSKRAHTLNISVFMLSFISTLMWYFEYLHALNALVYVFTTSLLASH